MSMGAKFKKWLDEPGIRIGVNCWGPLSAKITDLSLKLVLCASYQWLRRELIECKIAARSAEYRKIARSTAYTLLGTRDMQYRGLHHIKSLFLPLFPPI